MDFSYGKVVAYLASISTTESEDKWDKLVASCYSWPALQKGYPVHTWAREGRQTGVILAFQLRMEIFRTVGTVTADCSLDIRAMREGAVEYPRKAE